MNPHVLHHLLSLVAKTGDRLIVVDPTTEQPFVLMDLAHYTALIDDPVTFTAAPPSVATVNEDIAAWRASAGESISSAHRVDERPHAAPAVVTEPTAVYAAEPMQSATVDDDRFYVEPLE